MIFASPYVMVWLASVPGVLLLVVGILPAVRRRTPPAITTVALAMGLALLALQLFMAGIYTFDFLYDLGDSVPTIMSVPLLTFFITLGIQSRRRGVSLLSATAVSAVGLIGLWFLGGMVVIATACGISPSGGC